jgi:hypothetical protein
VVSLRRNANPSLRGTTLQTIQRVLEQAGVEFLSHGQPGVRLKKRGAGPGTIPGGDLNASNDE